MYRVDNCNTTNEISQPLSSASLKEKDPILKDEGIQKALSCIKCMEETSQSMDRIEQTEKEISNSLTRLEEGSEVLHTQIDSLIRSEERTKKALQKLAKSSSEINAITSNIANMISICANRIFNPVTNGLRNGFCFLTGHREPAAVLPRENQLAIEDNPENTISNMDPTNQTSIDEKKNLQTYSYFVRLLADYIFCMQENKGSCDIYLQRNKQFNI